MNVSTPQGKHDYRQSFKPFEVKALPVFQNGNIFRVDAAYYTDSDDKAGFTIRVNNHSGDWVSVDIDRSQGVASTGHIPNGQSGGFTEAIQLYEQRENKTTRWRPGAFGIPGNGGGEVWFEVPVSAGSAYLEISVIG